MKIVILFILLFMNCINSISPNVNKNDYLIENCSLMATYIICEYQDSALNYDTINNSFYGENTNDLEQKWHPITNVSENIFKTFSGGTPGGPSAIIIRCDSSYFNDSSIHCSVRVNNYEIDTFRLVDNRITKKCLSDSQSIYTLFIIRPERLSNKHFMGENVIKLNFFNNYDSYRYAIRVSHIIQRALFRECDSIGNRVENTFWSHIIEMNGIDFKRIYFKSTLKVLPNKINIFGTLKDSSVISKYSFNANALNPFEFNCTTIDDTLQLLTVNFKPIPDTNYTLHELSNDTISTQHFTIVSYQENNWSREVMSGEIGLKKQ